MTEKEQLRQKADSLLRRISESVPQPLYSALLIRMLDEEAKLAKRSDNEVYAHKLAEVLSEMKDTRVGNDELDQKADNLWASVRTSDTEGSQELYRALLFKMVENAMNEAKQDERHGDGQRLFAVWGEMLHREY